MARNRKRKTEIGMVPAEVMEEAVKKVINKDMGYFRASKVYNIPKTTLRRYVDKYKVASERNDAQTEDQSGMCINYQPNYACRQVFSKEEEDLLANYFLTISRQHYGITSKRAKEFAYDYAMANKKSMPQNWNNNKCAGADWLINFMKRHPTLSFRSAEATSLSRSTSFNKTNVNNFFNNLETVLKINPTIQPERIYNADETGCTTVHKTGKIIAQKGVKQVGVVTSGERGQLITVCAAISAIGNTVPPFFVFPRVHFKQHMLNGAPVGSAGASHSSGWMTSENFLLFLKHFSKHAYSTKENPVLLILDNHDSHKSPTNLQFAKDNGIILLTLPPHCSHKLQPLDKTIFGPFKRYYNAACHSWMMANPGKTITIYNIAELVGCAYPKATTPSNIQSGFRSTGIFPYNRNIFEDHEFLCSYVTDRDMPNSTILSTVSITNDFPNHDKNLATQPSTSCTTSMADYSPIPQSSNTSHSQKHILSPEQIHPYPKVAPRKKSSGRKRGRSCILTDTPEKLAIDEEAKQKELKKLQKSKLICLGKKGKRKLLESLTSEDEDGSEQPLGITQDSSEDWNESEPEDIINEEMEPVRVGNYVLIKFLTKRQIVYYVGLVISLSSMCYEVKFMRRKPGLNHFYFPEIPDESTVDKDDIIHVLPDPALCNENNRIAFHHSFPIDFLNYDVR